MFALFLTQMAAVVAVDAPVTAVTVYSDRARVTRTAQVTLGEKVEKVELPLLGDSTDPASIRVEAGGGGVDVRRVDIAHVDEEDFPIDEARKLLAELDAVNDRIARVGGEQEAATRLLDAVKRMVPSQPAPEPLKPAPKLNPTGWGQVFSFVDGWMDRMQARLREGREKLIDLEKDRRVLVEKAGLLGGARRRSGYRVSVLLAGRGAAKVSVTYMVAGARWVPTYDLQLQSDQKRVQVSLAGMVSQETGEDWNDAQLTLSTAIPATSMVMPRLLTWKIGERERFIPTPVPVSETIRPMPYPGRPPRGEREADVLRARLAQASGGQFTPAPADTDDEAEKKVPRTEIDFDKEVVEGDLVRPDAMAKSAPMRRPAMGPAAPPPPPMPMPSPARAPMMREEAVAESLSTTSGWGGAPAYEAPPPTVGVGLAPPPGYVPPSYGPDLPVTLAGGYDLTFKSLRPETIRTGKGARRVALSTQLWPVEVERRVFPALAQEAYVTAEINNPSQTALPGGQANLAVGDDPAGTARLSVVAPGEKFVLPLGLDRAIKPVRNVKLVQVEKGVISKDDYGEYTVTIEVANPYRVPLPLRVIDQLPLTDDKKVEVKALPQVMDPQPVEQDKITGGLEWRVTVPASGKSVIKFGYSIRRPKGWRMHQ